MIALMQMRGKRGPVFVGFLLCFLAAPGRADETQFLPEGCHIISSVNLAALLKSKTYQEIKNQMPDMEKEFASKLTEQTGIPFANIGRVTSGIVASAKEDVAIVVTATKPVSAAEIKAGKKFRSYQKNIVFKEMKVGAHTLHEMTYQYQADPKNPPSPIQSEGAFCVAAEKVVLLGRVEALRKILERIKTPKQSAAMQSGLKQAGFDNTLTLVVDLAGLPAQPRESLKKQIPIPGVEGLVDSVQTLALKANVADSIQISVLLTCKDADSAADVRKLADFGLVLLKAPLKDDPKQPAQVREMKRGASKLLDAVKVTAQGTEVHVDLTAEAVPVVKLMKLALATEQVQIKEAASQQARVLTQACQAYFLKNQVYPPNLETLVKKDAQGIGPYLQSVDALRDPWGQMYLYDASGPRNKGMGPDIWTKAPDGKIIGNWR